MSNNADLEYGLDFFTIIFFYFQTTCYFSFSTWYTTKSYYNQPEKLGFPSNAGVKDALEK